VSLDPLLLGSIFDIISSESGDYSVQKKKKKACNPCYARHSSL
jgi:hypothetical protein